MRAESFVLLKTKHVNETPCIDPRPWFSRPFTAISVGISLLSVLSPVLYVAGNNYKRLNKFNEKQRVVL